MSSFVHLHVHSEYSLLDGFSNIKKLVKRAKEMEMPAVALTDHGTMFGVIDFYNAATAAGIKPIVGVESYLAPRGMASRDPQQDKRSTHILLLAENQTGYGNLLKIASAAQLDGFYYYPRIDHEFLAQHAEGIICTSGCMSAEVPRMIMNGDMEGARKQLDWYYEVFGKENFFLELQQHDIPELDNINKMLFDLGRRYDANFVATNDVHYINKDDARLQDIMLAIQTGCLLSDPNRMRMTDNSYYLRSPEEMARLFKDVPGALSNTLLIAERCSIDLGFKGYKLPHFPVPEGYTAETYLRKLCEEGLQRRYGDRANDPAVRQRLDYELSVIHTMGFDAYFLIVWDLCCYASSHGIWYNARGSAAGSIVAYTLNITMVDPIDHKLIFERFLNPGRISMPDIDLDFRDDRRAEMMEYTARKYGDDKVAQIITFGTLGARAAIRDVARVMDIPLNEVDRVAKLIPAIPGKPVTIQGALEEITELKQVYSSSPKMRELIDTASQVEGVVRNAGTHAAGVIITDKPIVEYIPLHRPTGSSAAESPIKTVTQFEMSIVESLGLLKVDFLGLATLSIMARACDLIRERRGVDLNLNNIPTDDPETYELLGKGETAGVFQVEGAGMRRWLLQMKPKELANVIAMVALFRPGPMDFIPGYIRRMHGEEEVEYRHPMLEPIFKETYGYPVYQEQLMFAAMNLAGYTAPEADDLRKAIAKKMAEKLHKHRQKFIDGCVKNDIPAETASAIFDDWEEFARYGFNKCLPGSVEVVDAASGRMVRVGDLYQGTARLEQTVSCDIGTLRLGPRRVSAVMFNGVKPVFRLTTASGRSIEATANHPFYTYDGWRKLEALAVGDLIAAPRRIPVEGAQEWPDHQIIALGHLLAEEKEIPGEVFTLTNRQIALLISRMWEGDGHIDERGRSLFYASSSERMARQLQHLLLRLGILSRLRRVEFPYREGRKGYQLFITHQEQMERFKEQVGRYFVSERRRQALEAICRTGPGRGTKDIVPIGVKEQVRAAKEGAGLTWAEINARSGVAQREFYPRNSAGKVGFSRSTLSRLADFFDDPGLRRYAENDITWDAIAGIEYVGEQPTYDLEVPETHNFIANDLLVHNSHAVDYGVIAVQTAYLKRHYTVEYMTAVLSVNKNDTAKVALYAADCRRMGIPVEPPDVNASEWDFAIEDRDEGPVIRFGLGAVKNVGQGPVDAILKGRQDGPFEDLNAFARRVDLRTVGKRALESLVKVGALDRFGPRLAVLDSLDRIMSVSASHFRAAESGQMSLFGAHTGVVEQIQLPPATSEIPRREILNWERELIGLYVSDHPLTPVMNELDQAVSHYSGQLAEAGSNERVRVAGIITRVRHHQSKAGKPMGFATIEDLQGSIELVIFPRTWAEVANLIEIDRIVVVEGRVDAEGAEPKVLVDTVTTEFSMVTSADRPPAASAPPGSTPPAPARYQQEREAARRVSEPAPAARPAPPQPTATAGPPEPVNPVDEPPPGDDWSDMPPPPEPPDDWAFPESAFSAGPLDAPLEGLPPLPGPVQASRPGAAGAPTARAAVPASRLEQTRGPQPRGERPPAAVPSRPAEQRPPVQPPETPAEPEPEAAASAVRTEPVERAEPEPAGLAARAEAVDHVPAVSATPGTTAVTSEPAPIPAITLPRPLVSPSGDTGQEEDGAVHMVTVVLRSTGDKTRDVLRMRRIHGIITSYPGNDRFGFQILEKGRFYMLDFPNTPVGARAELIERLRALVGPDNVRVEKITFQ